MVQLHAHLPLGQAELLGFELTGCRVGQAVRQGPGGAFLPSLALCGPASSSLTTWFSSGAVPPDAEGAAALKPKRPRRPLLRLPRLTQ